MKAILVGSMLALAVLSGCRNDDGAGPGERLGKALDDATSKVTDSVQDELAKANDAVADARDKVEDATREASRGLERATDEVGKSVERAGEKMQEQADDIKQSGERERERDD